MLIDIIIISYVVLLAILVHFSESIPHFSLKIVLIGLFFSPIIGFLTYYYYQKLNKTTD
ncbi:MAG: hypothetical protein V1783_03130 [Bacteroidota bacterium]|jgi:hypothetical protein